jgi:hypothetical protein
MDPVTLAAAAMAIIRPFLGKFTDAATSKAADAAADAVGSGAQELYQAVRRRMTGDNYHLAVLQGAEDQPGSEDRIETLSRTLAAIIKADPGFAAEIANLAGHSAQEITVTDSGAVAGRDVNITATNAAARDLIIGGSTQP